MIHILSTLSNEKIKQSIKNQTGNSYEGIARFLESFSEKIEEVNSKTPLKSLRKQKQVKLLNQAHYDLTQQSFGGEKITNADAKKLIFQTIATLYKFPENSFINFCQDDTILANDAYSMVLPQFINNVPTSLGDPYSTLVSGAEIPLATPLALVGSKVEYAVDLFKVAPIGIGVNELVELPYDKVVAVMESMTGSLKATIPDYIANKWAFATSDVAVTKNNYLFLETTGAERDVDASPTAYTGKVKKLTLTDLRKVKTYFGMNNLEGQIHALISPMNAQDIADMMTGVTNLLYANTGEKLGAYKEYTDNEGVKIIEFEGIIFHIRQSLNGANVYYNYDASTKKYTRVNYGEVLANTSSPAMIFWMEDYVRKAYQKPTTFMLNNYPQSYGSIISITARCGATRWREDYKGVVVIAETQTTTVI